VVFYRRVQGKEAVDGSADQVFTRREAAARAGAGTCPFLAHVGYCGRYLPAFAATRWPGYAEDVPWTGIRLNT